MHGLCVLVLFPFCVYGLYVGNNGSSSSNNGLFYFNGNNTPDGNNNGSRLINPEGAYKNRSPLPRKKPHCSYQYDICIGDAFLTQRENIGDGKRS